MSPLQNQVYIHVYKRMKAMEGVCCTSKPQIESWESTPLSLTLVQQSLKCCVECKQFMLTTLLHRMLHLKRYK